MTRTIDDNVAMRLLDYYAREDFYLFVKRVFEEVKPGATFVPSLAVESMCAELTHLMDPNRPDPEEDNKVIFNLPPRHLKSIVCSVAYPLFVLGHDPAQTIFSITYGDELTRELAEMRRRVAEAPWYRRLFPKLIITRSTINELRTSRRGYIIGSSIAGANTGRGANHYIIDDPIKAADVYSKAKRDAVNEWFKNTLVSRPDNKLHARMIVVMQRLHVDDPSGVLIRTGQWYRRSYAAIAEHNHEIELMYGRTHKRLAGEALDPIREPLHVLEGLRAAMSEDVFSAQYQQRPIPPEGGIFKVKHFQRYDAAPRPASGDTVLISWDTALTETDRSDYTVGTVWLVRDDRFYLLELTRNRLGFPALQQAVLDARARFPMAHVLVEDAGSGKSLWQNLRHQGVDVIAVKVENDKIMRAHQATPVLEAGRIWLPRRAPWLDAFVAEVAAFPVNSSHDDQIDSMVHAINWWEKRKLTRRHTLFGTW